MRDRLVTLPPKKNLQQQYINYNIKRSLPRKSEKLLTIFNSYPQVVNKLLTIGREYLTYHGQTVVSILVTAKK